MALQPQLFSDPRFTDPRPPAGEPREPPSLWFGVVLCVMTGSALFFYAFFRLVYLRMQETRASFFPLDERHQQRRGTRRGHRR